MLLPAQPLSEHIGVLGAAVATRTADRQPLLKSPKREFGASRRSVGEVDVSQVQQPMQQDDASHLLDAGHIPLNGDVANHYQAIAPLVQDANVDNGLSSGNYLDAAALGFRLTGFSMISIIDLAISHVECLLVVEEVFFCRPGVLPNAPIQSTEGNR